MVKSVKRAFQFGPFLLDPEERLLRNGEERLDLPPRVFDTLLVLVNHSGHLLEKDRLMREVWPDAVVEENNLTQAIYLLRKVLRDGENGERYVETVPKRGYRFVALVREVESDPDLGLPTAEARSRSISAEAPSAEVDSLQGGLPEAGLPGDESGAKAGEVRIRMPIMIGVLLVLGILGTGYMAARRHRSFSAISATTGAATGSLPIRSIAVLPLSNLSADADQEYFADGMTDELITDLAQMREWRVVSKTSIMQYKGTRKPLPQIGRELGVDAVVEGSVLRSGDRVRITAQLIHAADDRHLWADSYEGELKDILALQSRVAEAITSNVQLNLTIEERNRFQSAAHFDPGAYDIYLRGRQFSNQRTVAGLRRAIEYFNQALAKDPNFSLAYAGLSDCYTLLALFGEGVKWLPDAESNARKALALDDNLAETHTSLAAVKVLQWEWPEAEKEFQRALDLNPNSAQTHQWYGNLYLGPMGRHAEAIAELKRAQSLDPLSSIIRSDLGYAYYLAGQNDAALREYQGVVATDPSFLPVHYYLWQYYNRLGMYDQAFQELREDYALSGRSQQAHEVEQLSSSQNRRRLFEAMAKSGSSPGSGSMIGSAFWFMELGERQSALDALQQSYKARDPGLIYIAVDPSFARLHSDPQFQDLEHRVGLQ